MEKLISKTNFLQYINCPKDTWLLINREDMFEDFNPSSFALSLMEQGDIVEKYARELFPGGVMIDEYNQDAADKTRELMDKMTPVIFQATFIVDGFVVKCDVLTYNKKNHSWSIHEVKGSNIDFGQDVKEDYEVDLAFQLNILERAGVVINSCFLIQPDRSYVRSGDLDLKQLFVRNDITDLVRKKMLEVGPLMDAAKEYLLRAEEPFGGCECHYKSRKGHCTTFEYSHPEIPAYSVHDIARINKKKLVELVDDEIFALEDIPDDFKLSDIQQNQVRAHRNKRPEIDTEEIQDELNSLEFPLYFLDYETFAPAIPEFDGFKSYTRIPFQFSLHVLRKAGGQLEHVEYLHEELSDPSHNVATLLDKHIGPKGTVIVWNDSFEKSVNNELADRNHEFGPLMERINSMVYDLMKIFSKQLYVHPDFHGSASIKKVLPVLVPELSYDSLDIHEGGQASSSWWEMVHSKDAGFVGDTAVKLKEYCKLDTYAMYAIWDKLNSL